MKVWAGSLRATGWIDRHALHRLHRWRALSLGLLVSLWTLTGTLLGYRDTISGSNHAALIRDEVRVGMWKGMSR